MKIVYLLEHDYTPEGLSFAGLKNHDRALGAVLGGAAAQAGCAVHLGIVHIEEMGPAEVAYRPRSRRRWGRYDDEEDAVSESSEYEVVEISEAVKYISHWVTPRDEKAPLPEIPLAEDELLPADALDGEPPDEDRVTEATGNEGATFERSYHRAAVVLWRQDRQHEVLLQSGIDAVMPYFQQLIAAGEQPVERLRDIAAVIIERWASSGRGFRSYRLTAEEKASRGDMLDLLRRIGDENLAEKFIQEVVLENYDGSENAALVKCGRVLSADKLAPLLQALFEKHVPLQPGACITLFSGLLRLKETAFAEPLCATLLNTLEKTQPPKDANQYFWGEPKPQAIDAAGLATLFKSVQRVGEDQLLLLARIVAANPGLFAPDEVVAPALKTIAASDASRGSRALTSLWKHAADFLLQRSEHPPVKPSDWARPVKLQCKCADCRELERFASDPVEQVHRFKMREDRRNHIEAAIHQKSMDIGCKTEKEGSPKTLVCVKNLATYERQCARHQKDIDRMKTILPLVEEPGAEVIALSQRMREAISRLQL